MLQLPLFDDGPALPDRIGRASVSRSESTSILRPGAGRIDWFDYTLNPYRGCSFDCSYCYAPSFVPDPAQREAWGTWVEAKMRSVEVLRRADLRGRTIFMSSVTDPYQPLELKIELTREILSELIRQQPRLVVQTRSPIVERDIDLLLQIHDVQVNLSITTDDDEIRKRFEPSCASIDRRLETIARLKRAGLRTCICMSPMLPMRDPEAFAKRIAHIGPSKVVSDYFNFSHKAFASNTRDQGARLAEEMGWNEQRYEATLRAMAPHLPMLKSYRLDKDPSKPKNFGTQQVSTLL